MHIYVDCETIPDQTPGARAEIEAKCIEQALSDVKADGRLAKPDKAKDEAERDLRQAAIDADLAAKRAAAMPAALAKADEEYRSLSLKGATAHVAAISMAIDEGDVIPLKCITEWRGVIDVTLERHVVRSFFECMMSMRSSQPIVVAHSAQFDIRMLWQRAVALGVPVPDWWPVDARPWDRTRIFDTMTMWAGERERISLDRLCRVLGVPGKGGIDGSKVYYAILGGRIDDVVEYCGDDVRRLRSCHRRLAGLKPLEADIARLTPPVDAVAA